MGGKNSKHSENSTSLNPNERRRVLSLFAPNSGQSDTFNLQEIKNVWQDLLVTDLLNTYSQFLFKQDSSNKNRIGIEQLLTLHRALVKGDYESKTLCIAALVSASDIKSDVISFNGLCKYVTDLLESYLKGARHRDDAYYKSWTHLSKPDRNIIECTVRGICSDLSRTNDDVNVNDLERWLHCSGLVNALHESVVGCMYNLQPEELTNLIPMARLPTTKTRTCLDPSQVIFLCSLIPFDNKSDWRFLFSTSIHGESFAKFVGCIVNQGPLLLVLECEDGNKFGGFISENINLGPRWVGTEDSFLFKLTPRTEVFVSTGYNNHYVYFNMNQNSLPNGLGMGGQFDYWGLWIDSQFGDGLCSESCTTFKNYNLLAAKKKFNIANLEVWGVGDPPPSAEEKGERGPKSVLDKDAAATHILEMAGRQAHSKGLRDEPEL